MQNILSTIIDKNIITFDSTNGRSTSPTQSGYSAAYWEYDDLDQYDKIRITLKAENPNNIEEVKIIIKGYSPINNPQI